MSNLMLFSENFSQRYLSQEGLNKLVLLFKKCNIQSCYIDEISKILIVFIKRYYANGQPAKSASYNINRVLQLLELRKQIWALAEGEVVKSKQSISQEFFIQKEREENIINSIGKNIEPGKRYAKLNEDALQALLTNPADVQLSFRKKNFSPKQKIEVKSEKKNVYNIIANFRFTFPFGANAKTTVTSYTNPYKILTIEDYLCRGMYKRYSPFICTGMTN